MTINENCPCKKKKCERHGNCVECRKHHAASKRQRPAACERTRKYLLPVFMLILFETVAVVLWLTLDNLFYLFNFSYIGISVSLGIFLFIRKYPYARRVAQLLVGLYMLLYLGLICQENMQIEGFWYYLFTGVFEAATIHYAVAKIFGPLLFGRGWCGYACWTAMVLDFLPYPVPKQRMGPVHHLCGISDVRGRALFRPCRRHGAGHVLGISDWKSAVLRCRYHVGISF